MFRLLQSLTEFFEQWVIIYIYSLIKLFIVREYLCVLFQLGIHHIVHIGHGIRHYRAELLFRLSVLNVEILDVCGENGLNAEIRWFDELEVGLEDCVGEFVSV